MCEHMPFIASCMPHTCLAVYGLLSFGLRNLFDKYEIWAAFRDIQGKVDFKSGGTTKERKKYKKCGKKCRKRCPSCATQRNAALQLSLLGRSASRLCRSCQRQSLGGPTTWQCTAVRIHQFWSDTKRICVYYVIIYNCTLYYSILYYIIHHILFYYMLS